MNKKVYFCECGEKHRLLTKQIVVKEHCFNDLIEDVLNEGNSFIVFNACENLFFLNELKLMLIKNQKKVKVFNLIRMEPKTFLVDRLQSCGKETIIAIGDEKLISIAKYYAYMWECEIIIFPVGEFLDYTFSKFARLNNGVCFDFYVTKEPKKIYVDTSINLYNSLHKLYIFSKYIAIFDNVVAKNVYKIKCCDKANNYLKKILKNYINFKCEHKNEMNKKNIWTLIRLGQGISFFSQTKMFFGGDKAIVDMLQIVVGNIDFLSAELISLRIIEKQYSIFYKEFPTKTNVYLENNIKKIADLIKISYVDVVKNLAPSECIFGKESIFQNFNIYFPYLKAVCKKCLLKVHYAIEKANGKDVCIKDFNLTKDKITSCFCLAPNIYKQPCSLHLFLAFGYLKLIE